MKDLNIYEKLTLLQQELKAPKNQRNKFGNYNYRSCEDILEALKPLLVKYRLNQFISDEIQVIGDRYYLKSTITLINIDKPIETIQATGLARESESKKGMDSSQITGSSSSYARKYALNGLYSIDDTKDFDDSYMSKKNTVNNISKGKNVPQTINKAQQNILIKIAAGKNDLAAEVIRKAGYNSSSDILVKDFEKICADLQDAVEYTGD